MTDVDPITRVRQSLQRQVVAAVLGNEKVARAHGLLVTDLQTLHLLVLREDVRTPSQISDATGMPTSTVTKLIDRLETAGYVRRRPDPADRRKTVLELVAESIARSASFMAERIRSSMTSADSSPTASSTP